VLAFSSCLVCIMKMKKFTSLFLVVIILIFATFLFVGCSRGEVVLSLGDTQIHADMYNFWMAHIKNHFIVSFADVQDTTAFWESAVGREVARQIEEETLRIAKELLVGNYLFGHYNLRLSPQSIAHIDNFIEQLIMSVHFGADRSALNRALLDNYGITINRFRQFLIMQEQANIALGYIMERYSPENLTDSEVNAFFTSQFHHFNFITIDLSYKTLLDDDGRPVRDTVGGGYTLIPILPEERDQRNLLAAELLSRVKAGDDFDDILNTYSDHRFYNPVPYGVYFSAQNFMQFAPEFGSELLLDVMAAHIGEIVYYEGEDRHIIAKKLPLAPNAFTIQRYAPFFRNFDGLVMLYHRNLVIAEHTEQIEENEEFLRLACAVLVQRGLGLLG